MIADCAIIGGGPAGLNAALVLGRARRKVLLFDDNKPRNAVTMHSHGFITRDGVKPSEFRAIGQQELTRYPSVEIIPLRVETVTKQAAAFELVAGDGTRYRANNILLATGFQEILPAVAGIYDYYGKSLFNCPFCDGWELRDKPLVVIAESETAASHLPKVVYNWSRDIVVCTNGQRVLNQEQKALFDKHNIGVIEDKIVGLTGKDGQLERVMFENGFEIKRAGGFVGVQWKQATTIGQVLGCELTSMGGIATDQMGRTSIKGVYAAGDTVNLLGQAQLILAAASGSRAAMTLIADFTADYFAE